MRNRITEAILAVPVFVKVMGIALAMAALLGPGGSEPSLMMLGAISLGALVLGPIASAAALRAQLG